MLSLVNGNLLRGAGVRRILRVYCKQLHLSGKARMASGKLVVSMKRTNYRCNNSLTDQTLSLCAELHSPYPGQPCAGIIFAESVYIML